MHSIDLTNTLTEDQLELLDRALDRVFYGGRVKLVKAVGQGRSISRPTSRVFLCHRLNEAGDDTGRPCAVKFVLSDPELPSRVWKDYRGWATYMAPEPPAMLSPHEEPDEGGTKSGVLLMQFVGGDFRPLSELGRQQPELLGQVVGMVLERLKPLHDYRRKREDPLPIIQVPLNDFLFTDKAGERSVRIARKDKDAVRARLNVELSHHWKAERIQDDERGFAVQSWVSHLLDDGELGEDPCMAPLGVIHGDLNFDNIFVSDSLRHSPRNVAIIDYERCRPGCLFDDLARIECELLFSVLPVPDRRLRGIHSDTGLVAAATTWSWTLREGALAGLSEEERAVFRTIRAVRRRAVQIAEDTRRLDSDGAALEHAYFAALLGRAFSYLRYDHVEARQRPRVFEGCLLLANRLAIRECGPQFVRFPDILTGSERDRGQTWDCDSSGYIIRAGGGLQYLSLKDASVDLQSPHIEAEFQVIGISDPEHAWVGLVIGATRNRYESGAGFRLRMDGHLLHVSEFGSVEDFGKVAESPVTGPVRLKLAAEEGAVKLMCGTESRSLRRLVPRGQIYLGAFGCEARIVRFAASDAAAVN
jgi:hypothetical protein